MIPGIKFPGAKFGERDYEELSEGKGRMCGDLSGMDWTRWAEERLCRETRYATGASPATGYVWWGYTGST